MLIWLLMAMGLLCAAVFRANDQLGDLGESDEQPVDPGGAVLENQTADTSPAGDTPGDSEPGQADPWSGAVPEWMKEKLGISTFGEILSSREEAQRQQEENQQLVEAQQELIRAYSRGVQTMAGNPGQAQAQAAPGPQNNWFGYGSKDAYVLAFNNNPSEVRAREFQQALKERPELRQQLQEMVQSEIAPLRQHAYQQNLDADYSSLVGRYPDANNPAVAGERSAVMNWARSNPWINSLKQQFPQVNIHEIAFKMGDYDRIHKELQAFKSQQKERQASAGTARSTVGGVAVRKTATTHPDAVERAAEILRSRGMEVTPEMVQIAKRGIESGGVSST